MVSYLDVPELGELLESGTPVLVDVGPSNEYEAAHVPGATWVPRYHLDRWLAEQPEREVPCVLTCPDGQVSTYAAAALSQQQEHSDIRVLDGGVAAWDAAGRSVCRGSGSMAYEPRDVVPKPYHQGEWAKRAYLDWEKKIGEKFAGESPQPDE
jgi:rhodanese-related sulfurtransferase